MVKRERSVKTDRRSDISKIRHSASHILAEAVLKLYPDVKLAIGPATEDGFYYDFEFAAPLPEEDLAKIEAEAKKLIREGRTFERSEKSIEEALKWAKDNKQPYKIELLEELQAKGEKMVSFYTSVANRHAELDSASPEIPKRVRDDKGVVQDDGSTTFTDLCEGPHITSSKEIGAFKLLTLAGAYWRGDEKNKMLTRIYGTAFATQKELDEYLAMLDEAKKRDHRKLGKELGIFTFDDDVGPGLPLWLPNGTVIIEELEKLARETEEKAGYKRVRTPHIAKESLYKKSGHLPYYVESMFPPMELEGEKYYLKAMNCPHHHKIFAAEPRSYRDLPLRLAEYGTCYRYEKSGELFGLMRARMLSMNDAHIYCSKEQFAQEFQAVNEMYLQYFKIFGIGKYVMRFSTHAPEGLGKKYVNEPKLWKETEAMVRKVLQDAKVPFVEIADEAAFYGPKIDVQVISSIGKEFSLATNQVDFAQPRRFNLTFTNAQGGEETPLCIHRAPLSTHERLIGFLLEHYAGKFPLWLSPVQVKILPINDKHSDYVNGIYQTLRKAGLRVELDQSNESIGKKIREAEVQKIPYMLVIGDKEKAEGTVAVRGRDKDDLGAMDTAKFVKHTHDEINQKR